MNTIVLAGGCFWGIQKFFDQFEGLKTIVGYANGNCENPTYHMVCNGSGHTEAIMIQYPDSISLMQLLAVFFEIIDPTSLNKQGNDVGINYRTGIYYTNHNQEETARAMLSDLQKRCKKPVVVELEPLKHFYPAESFHQKYLEANPYGYCHLPKSMMSGHSLPLMNIVEQFYPSARKYAEPSKSSKM